ncbi:MAG TPA: hypothetical protein VF221_04060, partial [Chloroflexota bacterium]
MRVPVSAVLTSLILVLTAPFVPGGAHRGAVAAGAPRPHATSPVSLRVAVGYGEQYRPSAWVPVRVTLRNRSEAQQSGTIIIPDRGQNSQFSSPSFYALYQVPVLLPPGATKHVTLYLPGRDIGDAVEVQLQQAGTVVTRASDSPSSFSDGAISVGALSGDQALASWIRRANPRNAAVDLVGLGASTLDPVPEALATFDAIVLTNADTSQLDRDQIAALKQYVQNGGSLVVVGGPDWQETLRPLPAALVPGHLAGSRRLSDLSGLRALGSGAPPRAPTIVSVLKRPQGSVVASQSGVPLVVRDTVGNGRLVYLAFDPSVDSIPRWHKAAAMLTSLIDQWTPQVIYRLSQSGFQSGFFRGRFSAGAMVQELSNVPSPTRPSMLLLVLLAVLSVLLLGPANFTVLHRLGRPELAWALIPILATVCLASTLAAAFHFKGNLVLLNTVGVVKMDGQGGSYPASLYVGLFSSVQGDYHMVWNGRGLAQSVPQYSFDNSTPTDNLPVGLRLSEGTQTEVDFPGMDMWAARGVALQTMVTIPGTIRSDLWLTPNGSIVGVVHNDTNLALQRPVILAGSAVSHLADLAPHTSQSVHIRPYVDTYEGERTVLWDRIYGLSPSTAALGAWDGDPWEAPRPISEASLLDRLRNVGERLPEARDIASSGGIVFVGWSQNALGSLTVDGASPRRRDLNLIESQLSMHFKPGSFQLRPGTLSATLVDGNATPPQNGCCEVSSTTQPVGLGPGGSATFQFDVPNSRRVHFLRLGISLNAGGAEETSVTQAYDWQAKEWVNFHISAGYARLSRPDRFISRNGALLVRVHATNASGDVVISDPHRDLQLS